MKIMHCPLNGPRNIAEVVYGGEVKEMPDPAGCSDSEWAAYLFMEENSPGVVREWWLHAPSSYWFIAERDRTSNEIIRTFPATELYAARMEYSPGE